MSRSLSGIEESDDTEQCRIPMFVKLPPLAVGHFAKVEEGNEVAEPEEVNDSVEERIARLEKALRRSSYQE